jgi:hypothetical protein
MNQRSIDFYLTRKELTAVAIYEGLVVTLAAEVISYPSLTHYLREAKFATSNPEITFSESVHKHDDCDQALFLAFDEQPFALICQLARLTHLSRTTVHWCLTHSLGFQVLRLRWISDRLSDAHKLNRVELSRTLLSVLRTQKGRHRHDIMTLDESWFYLNTRHESVWLPPDEKFSRENDTQFNRKN